jgi:hypothetical protein
MLAIASAVFNAMVRPMVAPGHRVVMRGVWFARKARATGQRRDAK